MPWTNADGLIVKFGIEEATPARVTEYSVNGARRRVEIVVDADFLPAGGTIVFDEYTIPLNAHLDTLRTTNSSENYAGGTSIQVAAVDKDGTSNVVNIGTALTTAQLNTNNHEESLDIQLTAMKYVQLTTVGTYTAGKSTIVFEWSVNKEESDTLVWDKDA